MLRKVISINNKEIPIVNFLYTPGEDVDHLHSSSVGDKGINLEKARKINCPVPEFMIMRSETSTLEEKSRYQVLEEGIHQLEEQTGRKFNNKQKPLIISVRTICSKYIPGYLDTGLCVGMTKAFLPALAKEYSKEIAEKIYFKTLLTLLHFLDQKKEEEFINTNKDNNVKNNIVLLEKIIIKDFKGAKLLTDPFEQAKLVLDKNYADFQSKIETIAVETEEIEPKPAIILQKMAFSIAGEYGVINTKNPETGKGFSILYSEKTFGDDVMTGDAVPQELTFNSLSYLKKRKPIVYKFLLEHKEEIEDILKDGATLEYVIDKGKFYLLQMNHVNKSPQAAFIVAYNLLKAGKILPEEIGTIVHPMHIKKIQDPTAVIEVSADFQFMGSGVSVLPRGTATGKVYFSKEKLLAAHKRGEKNLIFAKEGFDPAEDLEAIKVSDGIIALGNAVIHTRQISLLECIPCLYDLERSGLQITKEGLQFGHKLVKEGDYLTISSRKAKLYAGQATMRRSKLMSLEKKENVKLEPTERKYLSEVLTAYKKVQEMREDLEGKNIDSVLDLSNLLSEHERNKDENKAKLLANKWAQNNLQIIVNFLLKLDFGDHNNIHKLFKFLNNETAFIILDEMLAKHRIAGVGFGVLESLMNKDSIDFWEHFKDRPADIAYLIEEFLYDKAYSEIKSTYGDRGSTVREYLKRNGVKLKEVGEITDYMAKQFLGLKLSSVDINKVKKYCKSSKSKKLLNKLIKLKNADFDSWDFRDIKKNSSNKYHKNVKDFAGDENEF